MLDVSRIFEKEKKRNVVTNILIFADGHRTNIFTNTILIVPRSTACDMIPLIHVVIWILLSPCILKILSLDTITILRQYHNLQILSHHLQILYHHLQIFYRHLIPLAKKHMHESKNDQTIVYQINADWLVWGRLRIMDG